MKQNYKLENLTEESKLTYTATSSNQCPPLTYIYGKQYDRFDQIYYLCKTLDGQIEWIKKQKMSQNYIQLIINYESFHSRLLFSELYQKYVQEQQSIQATHTVYDQPQGEIKTEDKKSSNPIISLNMQSSSNKYQLSNSSQQPIQEEVYHAYQNKKRKINYVIEEITQSSPQDIRDNDVFITQINKKLKKQNNKYRINLFTPEQSYDQNEVKNNPKLTNMQYVIEQQKVFGSFKKDTPSHISNHKMDTKNFEKIQQNGEDIEIKKNQMQNYFFKIEWKTRDNGKKKRGNYYTYKEVKKIAPRLVLNYFQQLGRLIR